MKSKRVVLFLVGVFITGWAGVAMTQQAESQLQLVQEVHVKPGMVTQYEAARKENVASRGQNAFPFLERASVSAGPVYRYSTPLEGWEDLGKRIEWFQGRGPAPDFVRRMQEATDHTDRSIFRTRPDLGYVPDNRRIPPGEAGFIHRIRLYLRQGTQGEAAEILEKISALRRRHNIQDAVFVQSQVTGSDGPLVVLGFFARDAADYYSQSQKTGEMMGEEFQMLVRQINALCRRVERENWTARRDLRYQPSN